LKSAILQSVMFGLAVGTDPAAGADTGRKASKTPRTGQLLLFGLSLLVAAATSRHPSNTPLRRSGSLLVGRCWSVNVLSGRKNDLRLRRMLGRSRRRRWSLGGLGGERARARERCNSNQDEAGKHDRLPFQQASELARSSFRLPFDNWLRLLEYLSKSDLRECCIVAFFQAATAA